MENKDLLCREKILGYKEVREDNCKLINTYLTLLFTCINIKIGMN